MLLHRRPQARSSGRFIVTITCTSVTLFRQVDGFPVLVRTEATTIPRATLHSPSLPILPSSDNAEVFTFVARSASNDAVHDKLFIPTIASMGALVVICIFCCFQLIVSKETVRQRGAMVQDGYNEPPALHSQHAVGRQENGHGAPLSRGLSKFTRKSVPSTAGSIPPSVTSSNSPGFHLHLQQQRQQQQLLERQQQDPYHQYMMAHDHGYSHQQHHQHTPHHPSVAGSVVYRGEGVQPQPQPHGVQTHTIRPINPGSAGASRAPSVVTQTAQPPPFPNIAVPQPVTHQTPMNADPAVKSGREQHLSQQEYQNLQQQQQKQQQPDPRISSAKTSSTRVTSDVLSYMTPPEARRAPLPGNQLQSQPQNQNYFNARPANMISSQTQPGSSTHGMIAHSIPATYSPASRGTSTSNSAHAAHMNSNQPPRYAETRSDVQGKVITTPPSEKQRHQS